MKVLFSRIIIVGPGLLGGSVALAAARGHVCRTRVGVVRNRGNIPVLLNQGVADRAVSRLEDAFTTEDAAAGEEPNLVLLATPVRAIPRLMADVLTILHDCAPGEKKWFITDVGSTKAEITAAARELSFPKNVCYLGSHPIAGSEQSGPQNATASLFDDRVTIVTPDGYCGCESLVSEALPLITEFWERLGSRVVPLTVLEHDSLLAKTSHLPHVMSVALANLLTENELFAAGSGFRDMTRLAAGSDEVWIDILQTNRERLALELGKLIVALDSWKSLLERDDRDSMITLLQQAGKIRHALGS
ncbi:MAG: prephenate dehydrogenase/arogenate dehydrogenase family protein [Planctomycetia bacterium]|nr:prephenate dehydrogenase/arogenate dehydrogenase family protein [Planctomycetia bacterium]